MTTQSTAKPNTARRTGGEDSAKRALLLDVAARLMMEEGYAAVTSRRVATEAGLKAPLVHYYFRSMDDLFVALIHRLAVSNKTRQAEALASPQPLRALWRLASHPAAAAMTTEFAALANHRKEIRATIVQYAKEFRHQQLEVFEELARRSDPGIDAAELAAAVVTLTGIGRWLGMEHVMGITTGHDLVRKYVEQLLRTYEPGETTRKKPAVRTPR
jgi:AcrR family transcriptional regulator